MYSPEKGMFHFEAGYQIAQAALAIHLPGRFFVSSIAGLEFGFQCIGLFQEVIVEPVADL